MEKFALEGLNALAIITAGEALSNVPTKKNYVIRTFENKARLMPYGEAHKRGLLCEYLRDVAKYGITWIYFSRIADAKEVLSFLEKNGYTIV